MSSLCTHRFPTNAKLFCKWMHTSNSFFFFFLPTKNFAPPSPLPEREKNKQWTRWAITVHQKFCSAKENITRCNFYAYENLLPNYSREYFAEWKPKRIHRSKNSLYNTDKNARFVDVFLEKIYKLFSRKRKILAMQAKIINIILQFIYLFF